MSTRSRITLVVFALSLGASLGQALSVEETNRTPSDQMKDAITKVGKAPDTIGNSLQDLTNAAKEKLRDAFGGTAKPDNRVDPVDLNVPKQSPKTPAAPVGLDQSSRDPFRPMTLRSRVENKTRKRENLSPLERLELSQLKLVGIVWDVKDPRAMVEDSGGLGYVIKIGTPIGNNDGKVKAIHQNQVVVEEFYSDDYGARKKRDVGIKLSTE